MAKRGRPKKIDQVVNSPSHYLSGDIECIDAMVSAFGEDQVRIYAKINAFKYLWRAGKKEGATDTDLAKASWYTKRAAGEDPRGSHGV
jgi:hypothetical protein